MLKRARDEIEECKRAFKVKEGSFALIFLGTDVEITVVSAVVPKKVARLRKDGHVHAGGDEEDILLLDRKKPVRTQSLAKVNLPKPMTNGSDTESEKEDLLLDKMSKRPANNLPTPARSLSPDIDSKRAPGRIIGNTYPLADFRKNIAQGDVVSKAVEDFGFVIREIVMKPFSSRRTAELLECMRELRDVSLKVR